MKNYRRLAVSFLLLLLISLASCKGVGIERYYKGSVTGDLQVTEAGEYIVNGTVIIEPNAILIVPPGASLRLKQNSKLIVEGKLEIWAKKTKRVTVISEGSQGIYAGQGFSESNRVVTNPIAHIENCDVLGRWPKGFLTCNGATAQIQKNHFKVEAKYLVNTVGCDVVFDANRIENRNMVANDLNFTGCGQAYFVDNVFSGCKMPSDSFSIDGSGDIKFCGNSFSSCEFSGKEAPVKIDKFNKAEFVNNKLELNKIKATSMNVLELEALTEISMLRNLVENNSTTEKQNTLLHFRTRRANVFANRFNDNNNCQVLRLASNSISFNTNKINRNITKETLFEFGGRKGVEQASIHLLSCEYNENAADKHFKLISFGEAIFDTSTFKGNRKNDDSDYFIWAVGTQYVSFNSNTVEDMEIPVFGCPVVVDIMKADWIDPGNVIPAHSSVEFSVTLNELKNASIVLDPRREKGSLKPISWNISTNVIKNCKIIVLPDNYGGSVSSYFRYNKFRSCDKLEFFQGGPGGRTIIDRNLFTSCPVVELISEVKNPILDFLIISNSFESKGYGFKVKQIGDVHFYKNFFDDAVEFE